MKVIYLSSVCAQQRFDDLVEKGLINRQFQNQKFHHLLLKGLGENDKLNINVLSFYPINRTNKKLYRCEDEYEDKVHYIYPSYIDLPIIHHITKFFSTYRHISKLFERESVIACNIMNFDECLAALVYRRFHKVNVCAITADVPGLTSGAGSKTGSRWKQMAQKCISPFYRRMSLKYDAYMFLAQEMNKVINPKGKPYIVVEGLCDVAMAEIPNTVENKFTKKTLMYAGGLHREYGIELLVKAFQLIPDRDVELHIYGNGDFEDELVEITKKDTRIKYLGTKVNKEIVLAQTQAHLLINPRPTDAEFVKYSFPSKTIECMVSGTPLLTTRIPSMPVDYYPFVYIVDEETEIGFQKELAKILKLPLEELFNKGYEAKQFILKNKNYFVQSKKLENLLMSLKN